MFKDGKARRTGDVNKERHRGKRGGSVKIGGR